MASSVAPMQYYSPSSVQNTTCGGGAGNGGAGNGGRGGGGGCSLLPLAPTMTGLTYDRGAYNATLRQSVSPAQWVLAPYATPNCGACLEGDPWIAVGKSGAALCGGKMGAVDVESDLHNLTRPATRAPEGQYRGDGSPPMVCGSTNGSPALMPMRDCAGLATVDTRLVNPPCTLRGTGWNRWEWLCRNPQENALMPFDTNVDTSLVIKDNHRPTLACPLDQALAMPPGARNVDSRVGAPEWMPQGCPSTAGGSGGGLPVGPVGETPLLLWRSCSEVARM
jgi:hypothetical protein